MLSFVEQLDQLGLQKELTTFFFVIEGRPMATISSGRPNTWLVTA